MNESRTERLAEIEAQHAKNVAEEEANPTPPMKPMQALTWSMKTQAGFGYSKEYVEELRKWQAIEPELQNDTVTEMIRRVGVLVD